MNSDFRETVYAMVALHQARYQLPAMPLHGIGCDEDLYCRVAAMSYLDDGFSLPKNLSFKCGLESEKELVKAQITEMYDGEDLDRVLQMFELVHEEGF